MKPLFVISLLAITGCSPFDPDLGDAPYLCSADNPACPEGYTCQGTGEAAPRDMACLLAGGSLPDSNTGFDCIDDNFGENNMPSGAFVTPVAGSNPMFKALTSLCPATDVDHYQMTMTTVSALRVSATWESGMPVSVQILNAGGTSIGNGTPKGDNENCVCLRDLPMGMYFTKVFAGATTQNNYTVEIKVITAADCTAQPVCN